MRQITNVVVHQSSGSVYVDVPVGARIVDATSTPYGTGIALWMEAESPTLNWEKRRIQVLMTGSPILDGAEYVGSVLLNGLLVLVYQEPVS